MPPIKKINKGVAFYDERIVDLSSQKMLLWPLENVINRNKEK